jgi:hypothetical protein
MLKRTEIRALVLEKLRNHTVAGARVYDSELPAIPDADLPAISIFTSSELAQDGLLIVSLEIGAFVMANQGENVGALIDNLCQEIRTVLRRFWEDSGEFTASYQGTDLAFDPDGVQPFAAATMTYEVELLDE